jgi:hypothetical protein
MRSFYRVSLYLLLCSTLTVHAAKRKDFKTFISEQESEYKLKTGTIRKYLIYALGIIAPQIIARMNLCSKQGANLCSVGYGMKAVGDFGNYTNVQWLGSQAIWGALAHEILSWQPLETFSNNSLNAVHGFMGNITGNTVLPTETSKLNHTIAIITIGNLLKKLAEYW